MQKMAKNIVKEKIKRRLKRLLEGLYKNPERGVFFKPKKIEKITISGNYLSGHNIPAYKAGFFISK